MLYNSVLVPCMTNNMNIAGNDFFSLLSLQIQIKLSNNHHSKYTIGVHQICPHCVGAHTLSDTFRKFITMYPTCSLLVATSSPCTTSGPSPPSPSPVVVSDPTLVSLSSIPRPGSVGRLKANTADLATWFCTRENASNSLALI